MSEAKLTNKELWRVFRHQLTIRGANNYERQQNAGFTEAMMPVIEKYYDDPEEKKEEYARHMVLSEFWVFQEKVDMKVSAFSFTTSLLVFGYL